MKKIILLVGITILASCASIKNHNAHLNDLISVTNSKTDVDLAYKKIKKLHPNLYYYISRKDLDFKFDSIKNTITKPITSFELYTKLSPVVAAVRQGHMFTYPAVKQFTKKENKLLKAKGTAPLSQFDYEFFGDKMYVIKNKSYNKKISVGTEVVSVNGQKTIDFYNEFKNLFSSDGYNTTFKKKIVGKRFGIYYAMLKGLKDSINFEFKKNDTLKTILIKRGITDSTAIKRKLAKLPLTEVEKAKIIADKKIFKTKKSIFGYDEAAKVYNRELSFLEKDSSIAVIKIKSFTKGKFKPFFKQSFEKIAKTKSKVLVLDLRDNTGGRLAEIENLYTYLADSTFVFNDDAEMTSRFSVINNYMKSGGIIGKVFKFATAPISVPILYFMTTKKDDGKIYLKMSSPTKINKNNFKGKIYVLINGSSFSASSIISSNLKGSKRAYFVGEETGGDYNGTVAGQMPIVELPNSKIKIKIGLMNCVPFYKTDVLGHGIYPDKEILPTIQNRIDNVDPEMNWILDDIKKTQKVTSN
jgi:C-terminal processing protease CtpA/Prc